MAEKDEKVEETSAIKVAGKEFATVEELTKSYEELQKMAGRQAQELGDARKALSKPEKKSTDYSQYTQEALDENPTQFFTDIIKVAKREVLADLDDQKHDEGIWNEFFKENPELGKTDEARAAIKQHSESYLGKSFYGRTRGEQFNFLKDHWNGVFGIDQEPAKQTFSESPGSSETKTDEEPKGEEKRSSNMLSAINQRFHTPKEEK